MDTAQRAMGIGWSTAAELIRRSVAHASSCQSALKSGKNATSQVTDLVFKVQKLYILFPPTIKGETDGDPRKQSAGQEGTSIFPKCRSKKEGQA
jgi:Protein of unknown function (DUF993)